MTCRVATIDDLPRLMQLARMEMSRSRFKDEPFDHDRAEAVFKQFMSSLLSRVLISESRLGFIAGMIQPNLHNKRFTAYETCWYAEDGSGLALLGQVVTELVQSGPPQVQTGHQGRFHFHIEPAFDGP